MSLANNLKARGNELFASGAFEEAIGNYRLAIEIQDDPIEKAKLYSNKSSCLCNLGRYEEAAEDSAMCTQLYPTWPKGYYKLAEALLWIKAPSFALVSAMDAYTLDLTNVESRALVRAIADRINAAAPVTTSIEDLPGSPVPVGSRYMSKWMPDDDPVGWLALDTREQWLRSPARTCAHCLELGMASGMFTTSVMEAWEESGVLLVHLVGASSLFELAARLEDLIHLLPWVREVELVLVGFKWILQKEATVALGGTAAAPANGANGLINGGAVPHPKDKKKTDHAKTAQQKKNLELGRIPDPGAPNPPGVLVTLSKRRFMEGRKMFIRGFCGDYHTFASTHSYLSPHFAVIMNPGLDSDYDSWAPTISSMISKNIPTFITGCDADKSRPHHAVIVQYLGGKIAVPPQTNRFPIIPTQSASSTDATIPTNTSANNSANTNGASVPVSVCGSAATTERRGVVRNHNIMAFQGCNLAVQHDMMNQPTTSANFQSTKRYLRNLGIDIADSNTLTHITKGPGGTANGGNHAHNSGSNNHKHGSRGSHHHGGEKCSQQGASLPMPAKETEQLVLKVLEATCPETLKGLSDLPLDLAMSKIVEGVKKHMGPT